MRKYLVIFALSLVFQSSLPNPAGAIGKIYGRIPRLVTSPIYNLSIVSFEAEVKIVDQLATTRIVQEFANESWQQLEGIFVLELPKDARITSLSLWKSGERVEYNLKSLVDAREVYQEIVPRPNDELFPAVESENIFRLRLFPIEAKSTCKIEVGYFHLLEANSGALNYSLQLGVSGYTDLPLSRGQVTVHIQSQDPIRQIKAPVALHINQPDANHCEVLYELEDELPAGDLSIDYQIDSESRCFKVLTCDSLSTQEDKYFTLWITPPDSLFQDTLLVKEIVFVVDHSASMEGNRLRQVKRALNDYLDQLQPVDRFNILAFSNDVTQFRSNLVPASAPMIAAAKNYVAQLSADALANFEAAITAALRHNFTNWTRRVVVVITDGQPNAGITDTESILANIAAANTADVSIYPVGIGDEVNHSLLNTLATQYDGFPFFLSDSDTLSTAINQLRPHIRVPVLSDMRMTYSGIQAIDLFPREKGNLIRGVQQVIRGRYQGSGTVQWRLAGNVGNTPVEIIQAVQLGVQEEIQVARLWAASKIDYYLNMIQIYGEVDELVNAVISFSQKYQLLTPYTAFLLIEPGSGIPAGIATIDRTAEFQLTQNFPNPFNPVTTISYQLGGSGAQPVKITIFNQLGQMVINLMETRQLPGKYQIEWNGEDKAGLPVSSGLYFYRIETPGFSQTRTMLLLR